nr:NADH dehydrogenase subunit 3 [Grifola frondosa]
MLFIFVPVLSLVLLALNLFLAPHIPDEAKVSAYECGFQQIPLQTRSTFQIHFYLVAILFLVFDLEILLLLPIAVSLYQVSIFGFSIAIIFFIVLTIGFILEIGTGAIKITSSNQSINSTPFPLSKYQFNNRKLKTGKYPAIIPNNVSYNQLNPVYDKMVDEGNTLIESMSRVGGGGGSTC